mmetsp:Transcript_26080/g.59077  ORF Transcript_26080/g.59077 Transcript_26080/m.59077 type:complete len:237 (-) Transcript_26080:166-876(-)
MEVVVRVVVHVRANSTDESFDPFVRNRQLGRKSELNKHLQQQMTEIIRIERQCVQTQRLQQLLAPLEAVLVPLRPWRDRFAAGRMCQRHYILHVVLRHQRHPPELLSHELHQEVSQAKVPVVPAALHSGPGLHLVSHHHPPPRRVAPQPREPFMGASNVDRRWIAVLWIQSRQPQQLTCFGDRGGCDLSECEDMSAFPVVHPAHPPPPARSKALGTGSQEMRSDSCKPSFSDGFSL